MDTQRAAAGDHQKEHGGERARQPALRTYRGKDMADAVQLQQRAGDGGVHGELEPDAGAEEEGRQAGGIVRVKQIPITPTSLLNLGPISKKLVALFGCL